MRAALLGLLLALALTAPASAQTIETGDPEDCFEAVPAALTPPPFADPIDVRVLVLLDGVNEASADAHLQSAAAAYVPLALRVKAVEFRPVSLKTTDSSGLIAESRAAVGGGRPAGADLVYTFTDKNMTGGVYGDGVAGQADCIGGVYSAETAFAVGEADDSQDLIAGHELGHLFGAHHHYANCAESQICTLMINDVGLASMRFSSMNGSVVRGHAEAYLPGEPFPGAPPAGTEPPPQEPAPQEPAPQPQPEPQPQPQQQPAQPQQQPQSPPPVDADRERPARACTAARAALKKAGRKVAAARKQLRRKATPPRRRALRRAVAARARASRAVTRACD